LQRAARRLLIVDDDPAFRAYARERLHGPLFDVVAEAASSDDAAALAGRQRAAVALVDARLGGEVGFQAAKRLSELGLVVVMTSVDGSPVYRDLAIAYGAAGFLSKADLSDDALASILGNQIE